MIGDCYENITNNGHSIYGLKSFVTSNNDDGSCAMKPTKTLFIYNGILYEKAKAVDGSDTSNWLSPSREIKYGNPQKVGE